MNDSNTITLAAVGDIMLGEGIQRIRRGVRTIWNEKRADHLLAHMEHVFKPADISFGNLECMLGEVDLCDPRKMIYIGDPAHIAGLRALGFTHLALANNHVLEQGLLVAEATRKFVEHSGIISCCGNNSTRFVIRNIGVEFFAFNLIDDTPDWGFYRSDVTQTDIDAIRSSKAKIRIVSIHWGDEYSRYPSPKQIRLAHNLVDAGACLILGHHPHVTQGLEEYRGALVAYSLGNFVFDMNWSEDTSSSFILHVTIHDGKVCSFRTLPVRQDHTFVPQFVTEPAVPILPEALVYDMREHDYDRYKRRCLNQARLRAISYLIKNLAKVDRLTWQILIAKRFPRIWRR